MDNQPLVSVCIPVFNGEQYLDRTLASLSEQSYKNLEVIIVDDGSTDRSYEIAHQYSGQNSNVTTHKNGTRLGLVGNWNKCVSLANGEWIKFLFQDDLLVPNCIERMIKAVQNDTEKHYLAFCRREFIYNNTDESDEVASGLRGLKFIWDRHPDKTQYLPLDTALATTRWPEQNVFGEPTSYLIHTKVFESIGKFDPAFHHVCDIEFWTRAATKFDAIHIPESLVKFRVHDSSTSSFNHQEKWFHVRYLERTRLFAKYACSPQFSEFRDLLANGPSALYLKTQAAIYLRRARIASRQSDRIEWVNEVRETEVKHPDIYRLSQKPLLILAPVFAISKLGLFMKSFFPRA